MESLSWNQWKNELKKYVDGFTQSKGLKMASVLDVCQKRHASGKWDMSLMFIPSAESSQMSEEVLNELCELLPEVSKDWKYQISSAHESSRRIMLTLSRISVCIGAIQTIMSLISVDLKEERMMLYQDLDLSPADDISLTVARQQLARDVILRLLGWAGYDVINVGGNRDVLSHALDTFPASDSLICVTGDARLPLPFGSAAAEQGGGERGDGDGGRREWRRAARVVVEPVVDIETGKKALHVTANEFMRGREAALLSAGRSRERGCPPEAAGRLAAASVAHQLLAVSLNSPCRLSLGAGAGAGADGAVFVHYNVARLTALLERFQVEERRGTYPPLPPLAEMAERFARLTSEDEWELVWRHLLPFPSLLHSCVDGALVGRPALHKLCSGLVALSHAFSRYYSRTHVLTPPLEHLVDTLHARIHLLKAVKYVFDTYFHLLGYQPLERM